MIILVLNVKGQQIKRRMEMDYIPVNTIIIVLVFAAVLYGIVKILKK